MAIDNKTIQELTKTTGLDERAIRSLVSAIANEGQARRRRGLAALLVVSVLVVGSTVVAGVPSQLATFLMRAGPPAETESAPRQLVYSGVLEQQGAPVTNASVPMRFTLYGRDGGVLHQESASPAVSNGRFRVELGDSTPIPAAVFRGNFVELEVSAGSPLQALGRQRILSVPYALHTDDVVVQSRTITVGASGQFPTLESAWAWLQTKVVLAPVTIKILDGSYSVPAGGLALNHPNGSLISVVGNTLNPALVIFNATDRGFAITEGNRLRLIDGIRLVGPGMPASAGIELSDSALVTLGPNLRVSAFENGISGERNSTINIRGLEVSGNGPMLGGCIIADTATHLDVITFTASNCSTGIYLSRGSSALIRAGSVSSASGAVWAGKGSTGDIGSISVSGIASPAFRASEMSYMIVGTTGATYSPPLNTQVGSSGNLNSTIGQ